MAFSDSHKFRTEVLWGQLHPVHHRDLGEKKGDLYPGKKWSDVAIDGVSLDDTIHWDNQIDYLKYYSDMAEGTGGEGTMINDKKMDNMIHESGTTDISIKGTGESKNFAGIGKSDQDTIHRKWLMDNIKGLSSKLNGKHKTFYRKRKIPTLKNKNYPVKPIRDNQTEKKTEVAEKYDEIIDVYDTKVFEAEDVLFDDGVLSDEEEEDQWRIDEELIHSIYPSPAFIQGDTTDDWYITYYDQAGDTYRIRKSTDYYGTPVDYSRVMWCPPKMWIRPIIQWDKIWGELDYTRNGVIRSYEYSPPKREIWQGSFESSPEMNARIQFHGPSL